MSVEKLSELKKTPEAMAHAIRPLMLAVTPDRYLAFLDMMYHYTLKSGERLHAAAAKITDPSAKALFTELARDETNHYRLAEMDLQAFGKKPSTETPREVAEFHDFWMGIRADQQDLYFGAMYALESVADHLQNEAKASLGSLGLKPNQARFVLVHLEADVGHGAQLAELCQGRMNGSPELLLEGARRGGDFWVALHERALRG